MRVAWNDAALRLLGAANHGRVFHTRATLVRPRRRERSWPFIPCAASTGRRAGLPSARAAAAGPGVARAARLRVVAPAVRS
jgi:hypothetical protein